MKISPPPQTPCQGCGVLHGLVDRLTLAVEALEALTARLGPLQPFPRPPWRDTGRHDGGEAA